ncbi:peptidase T-like protein [Geoalkalibacter ferrihydriticus]|uniref:Peptidase M20 n=2 Tax=Geoalkalibacter ferrihydriticus TaxID=392333 RepID=A0A0C2HNF4_9BACT|nr:M20/M25/M40 family metallo-hydrolase [Geoalkalibacter ferrihydriticus]KIH76480.1 peptidase M20 [Geoalkalibacter ferrihydriticus DSM 17813]SDL97486.1 peptidase T-like protein [Geoalkalibacter ferrihydriticus]
MINHTRISEEFARLAAIASPSFGEGEISRYLRERLTRLGGEVKFDDAGARIGSESGNLVAYFPSQGRDCAPFMLSLHMDMVEPAMGVVPVLCDGVFTSAGDTVLGADDKAGIAEVIEALEVMHEQGIARGPVEVVITVCEEVGLLGAKHLDFSLIKSRRGLALDTSGVDLAIHRAPAGNKLRIEVIGREAHAGISPEKGLSAIEVTARAIARMRLGRVDEETTANIGTIHGGQAINIVPRQVVVEGEARSHDPQRLEAQTEHMIQCFQDAARELRREIEGVLVAPEVRWEIISDYPMMNVPLDAPMVALIREAAAALGQPLTVRSAGGGSDANIFNAQGIETLILGTGMTNVHTVDESVSVADMARVTELLVETLRRA